MSVSSSFEPSSPADPADARFDRAWVAFSSLMRDLHRLDRSDWIDLDLTMSQLKTIMMVVDSGGLTGRDLALRLGVGAPAITALVDRLVQRGYVRREDDLTDRRVTWNRPTERATALFERLHIAHREKLVAILTMLSPEDLALVERALVLLGTAASRKAAERGLEGPGCP